MRCSNSTQLQGHFLTYGVSCVDFVYPFSVCCLGDGAVQHHRDDLVITLKRVVAGGLAGMLAKSVVAPVDRVKILFQVTNEKFSFKKVRLDKVCVFVCLAPIISTHAVRTLPTAPEIGPMRSAAVVFSRSFISYQCLKKFEHTRSMVGGEKRLCTPVGTSRFE